MQMTWISRIFSFLFPPECLGCHREDYFVCPDCVRKIPNKLPEKSFRLQHFEKIFVFTDYQNPIVEKAIKKLKFRFSRSVLNNLEPFFQKYFPQEVFPPNAIFVPVPLHFLRKNERGFNQSELLAQMFSRIFCGEDRVFPLLQRIRNTPHQSHLSKDERKDNVQGAFVINSVETRQLVRRSPDRDEGGCCVSTPIILIDDVATTGSTLSECAKTLRKHGYRQIWGLVVARGK